MKPIDVADLFVILGAAITVAGATWFHPSIGLVVLGAELLVIGLMLGNRRTR